MADLALSGRLDRLVDTILARGDATAALADPELAPFARLVVEMRHYPDPRFTAGLKARLKERTTMSTATAPAIPTTTRAREGFTTITPYMRARDTGLTDFLKHVFGAVETETTTTPNGVHRELRVGDSMLMIGEGAQENVVPVRPSAYHVYVEDVDATYARALTAGGTSMGEPADRPYGERSGYVRDPFGNYWYIARSLGASAVPAGLRTVTPYLHPQGAPAFIDFLKGAFGAVEEARHLDPGGRVMHAQVRIGNAVLELGEPDPAAPMPTTFYLYVDDADALFERAVAAGATSVAPPADQSYGDRVASVTDSMGNLWYIARPA